MSFKSDIFLGVENLNLAYFGRLRGREVSGRSRLALYRQYRTTSRYPFTCVAQKKWASR